MPTRKEARETEAMLARLQAIGISRGDAESLRRISMTLRRWFELECGDCNSSRSQALVRGVKFGGDFGHDENGKPYLETIYASSQNTRHYYPIPDRERGARNRLATILKRYPTLTAYVQTDPRGCALYILRPGDIPPIKEHFCASGEYTIDGGPDLYPSYKAALSAAISSYYSRGVAVHQ